jgi:hypothetical protein
MSPQRIQCVCPICQRTLRVRNEPNRFFRRVTVRLCAPCREVLKREACR